MPTDLAHESAATRERRLAYGRTYSARWRQLNPDAKRAHNIASNAARAAFLRAQKGGRWCLDCGYIGPPEAMDFDHVRGEKVREVGLLTIRQMVREIPKCDLICACCHRIRTAARRG